MQLANEESVSRLDQYLDDIEVKQRKSRKRKTMVYGCLTIPPIFFASYLLFQNLQNTQSLISSLSRVIHTPSNVNKLSSKIVSPAVSFDSSTVYASVPPVSYSVQDNTSFLSQTEISSTNIQSQTPVPTFPGGKMALRKFLSQHMTYPVQAKKEKVEGKVYIEFTVGKDGTIATPVVTQSLGYGCDQEAVRLIKAMPKWNPATQEGKLVSSIAELVIEFRII